MSKPYVRRKSGLWVNTELFSPVVVDGIPPPDSQYYESFYREQRDIIMNTGYSVGGESITGDHYWYLNFWKIRGLNRKTGRKGIIPPRFLALDHEYFHILDKARSLDKNVCLTKGRQTGFSEKNAAIIGKEYSFYPASQSVIVSGLEFYTQNTMNFVKRGLNNLANTEFYKRALVNRKDYMKSGFKKKIIGENGEETIVEVGYFSEIYAITAKNNPQAVSSRSPSFVLFEESGVFPGVIETYKFIKPSMYAEGRKTGFCVFVGTGGVMEKGAEELEYIVFHPDEFDCLAFDLSEWEDDVEPGTVKMGWFCPKTKFKIVDENGNPDIEASTKAILKEREEIEDDDKRYTAITQEPITPSESFLIKSGGFFGKGTSHKLNSIKAQIKKDKLLRIERRGSLDWVYREHNGRKIITDVKFTPDDNGIHYITEMPYISKDTRSTPPGLYAAGTDSYDKDEANTSTSKLSTQIFKTFLHNGETYNIFVAGLHYRPSIAEGGSEAAYEESAKLCYFYNAMNLIEWSNIRIFNWYEKHNFGYLLKERPDIMIAQWIKNSQVSNRYGVDPSTKIHWLSLLSDYLKKEWHKMRSLKQIEAFIRYKLDKNYNCDITIASSLAYLNAYEMMEAKRRENTEPGRKKKNGKMSPLPKYKLIGNNLVTV